MKRILMGIIWFAACYIGLNYIFVMEVYFTSGAAFMSTENDYVLGLQTGHLLAQNSIQILLLIIAGLLSGILSAKRILPGTKRRETSRL